MIFSLRYISLPVSFSCFCNVVQSVSFQGSYPCWGWLQKMRAHQFVFQIFYSTTFTLLLFLEILLLLISPGDIIYQSFAQDKSWNIVTIAGVYALTLLVALFIIATRLYAARKDLQAIPKAYVPVREGDVSKSVRKLVSEGLARSVLIAYNAHPREVGEEEMRALEQENRDIESLANTKSWLKIEHPGWSSPYSLYMPNLQYELVVLEFPNLIEAKAVSLAPPTSLFEASISSDPEPPPPDPLARSLLQRPASLPLRDYLSHLISLNVLGASATTTRFVQLYESARFSKNPLHELTFRTMLADFTTIMQALQPLPAGILASVASGESSSRSSTPTPTRTPPPKTPTPSLEPSIHPSQSNLRRTPTQPQPNHQTNRRPSLAPRSISPRSRSNYAPSPLSTSATPFMTPRPTPYEASLSSGHAGDRSSECSSDSDSDSDSVRSAHTAFTRPRAARSKTGTSAASKSMGRDRQGEKFDSPSVRPTEGSKRTPEVSLGLGLGLEESNLRGGNVEHPVSSTREASEDSGTSGLSDGSVIRREGKAEAVLDLPVAFAVETKGDRSAP